MEQSLYLSASVMDYLHLVYEVVRMAEKYGAEVPAYRRAVEKFREMEVK